MSLTLTPVTSTTPFLVSEEPKELDIVQKKEQLVQVVKSALESFLLPSDLQGLIKNYLFVDITEIYHSLGISFTYIPKSIPQSSGILTGEQRETRVRTDRDDILSRLHREFEFAQAEMEQEKSKGLKYLSGDAIPAGKPIQMGDFTVGTFSFVGVKGSSWDGSFNETLNEDRWVAEELTLTIKGQVHLMPFIAVLDGHGGPEMAEYGKVHLKTVLLETLLEFNEGGLSEAGIWNALKLVCVRLTQQWSMSGARTDNAGSTVLFIIEVDGWVYIANLGDSRAVLNNNGKYIQLTEDIKPGKPRFRQSIEHRGGVVEEVVGIYRVNQSLSCGRAAGDLNQDKAMSGRSKLTMLPASYLKSGSDIIVASDGVFDVASSQQILEVDEQHRDLPPEILARDIVFSSYAAGSIDNLTAVVIRKEKKENKMREA